MDCAENQRMINRFVDNEVKAADSAELFGHLRKCGECREFFDLLMKLNLELDNQIDQFGYEQFNETKRFHEKRSSLSKPARYVLTFLRHRFSVSTPIVALVGVALLVFTIMFLRAPQSHPKSASVRQAPEVQITTLPVVDLR